MRISLLAETITPSTFGSLQPGIPIEEARRIVQRDGIPLLPLQRQSACVHRSSRNGEQFWTVYQTVYHGLRELRPVSARAIFGQSKSR